MLPTTRQRARRESNGQRACGHDVRRGVHASLRLKGRKLKLPAARAFGFVEQSVAATKTVRSPNGRHASPMRGATFLSFAVMLTARPLDCCLHQVAKQRGSRYLRALRLEIDLIGLARHDDRPLARGSNAAA